MGGRRFKSLPMTLLHVQEAWWTLWNRRLIKLAKVTTSNDSLQNPNNQVKKHQIYKLLNNIKRKCRRANCWMAFLRFFYYLCYLFVECSAYKIPLHNDKWIISSPKQLIWLKIYSFYLNTLLFVYFILIFLLFLL